VEYNQLFGEDTVPYRRFPTLPAANFPNTERLYNQLTRQNDELVVPSFEPVKSKVDYVGVSRSVMPAAEHLAVTPARPKVARIHRLQAGMAETEVAVVVNAVYQQVLDVFTDEVPEALRCPELELQLQQGEITVREFVRLLASSSIYRQRFCTPYPSAKVVDLLFRHLIGRPAANQSEAQQYETLLVEEGLEKAVTAMVNSSEYVRYFREDVVPYRRSPALDS